MEGQKHLEVGRGVLKASPIYDISLLLKIHLKQTQLNVIPHDTGVMAACTGNFILFSAFFYMFEICHGSSEGVEKKRNKEKEKKRKKMREKAASHF